MVGAPWRRRASTTVQTAWPIGPEAIGFRSPLVRTGGPAHCFPPRWTNLLMILQAFWPLVARPPRFLYLPPFNPVFLSAIKPTSQRNGGLPILGWCCFRRKCICKKHCSALSETTALPYHSIRLLMMWSTPAPMRDRIRPKTGCYLWRRLTSCCTDKAVPIPSRSWDGEGHLAGGVFGLVSNQLLSVESMFTRVNHASKITLAHLCAHLRHWGYPCIDMQMPTDHLASLGCRPIPRDDYLALVNQASKATVPATPWRIEVKPGNDGAPVLLDRGAQSLAS